MVSPIEMAWLGHSGSQTSQLMHSSVIFKAMATPLSSRPGRRAGGAAPTAPLVGALGPPTLALLPPAGALQRRGAPPSGPPGPPRRPRAPAGSIGVSPWL